jgi:hypothetical protein
LVQCGEDGPAVGVRYKGQEVEGEPDRDDGQGEGRCFRGGFRRSGGRSGDESVGGVVVVSSRSARRRPAARAPKRRLSSRAQLVPIQNRLATQGNARTGASSRDELPALGSS